MLKLKLVLFVPTALAFPITTYFAGPAWGVLAAIICFVAIYAGVVMWYGLESALERAFGRIFYDPSKHEG